MRNNAKLVMELLSGSKYMTVSKSSDRDEPEQPMWFTYINEEELLASVHIQGLTKDDKNLSLPINFDIVRGLEDVLRLIVAFTYPDDEAKFKVYTREDDVLDAIFLVYTSINGGSRTVCRRKIASQRN